MTEPKRKQWFYGLLALLAAAVLAVFFLGNPGNLTPPETVPTISSEPTLSKEQTEPETVPVPSEPIAPETEQPETTEPAGPDLSGIPDDLLELMERNPEASDYVLNYPEEHDKPHEIDMERFQDSQGVPLFIQWDPMWGYLDYGGNEVGLSGCGPVCLAMAGAYVTGDYETFRPDRMVEFALEEGYRVPGNGTKWTLIGEGAKKLGLDVTEIPLNRNRIIRNLEEGNPIICVVGPGVFTTSGHFIVLTDYEDGRFRVNDPNSPARSAKLWDFEEFSDSVRNLWVIRTK